MRTFLSLLITLFLCAFVAGAETLPKAWDAAEGGDYDRAVEISEGLETTDGYVFAASAMIAKILTLQSEDIKDDAKQARDYAEEALEREPQNSEALLQYAVAYGIVTRASSNFTVWRKKMPQKSYAAIKAAQIANPSDARVDALLGSWHLGIVRKAGAQRGEDMFGANEAAGIAAFEAATLKAPDDIVVTVNYALSALALDPAAYGERGKAILQHAIQLSAQSDIERTYQRWAMGLLNIFEDSDALQKRASYLVDGE